MRRQQGEAPRKGLRLPIFSPYLLDRDEWELIVGDFHFVEKG